MERQKMKNKKTAIFIFIIIAALAGAAFYFLYFIRTPAYALNQARLAVQQHDTEKFQRYVDLQSVMDNAFEDTIKAESKITNADLFSNPFALGILHMLKPSVVELMKQEALNKIAAKPKQEEKAVDPVPDAMRRNIERHIPLDKFTFKDLKLTKHAAAEATAALVLHNKNLNKDFIVNLQMLNNENGDWQIKKVDNLAELIIQLEAAKQAKQAAENQEVIDRLNKAVSASEIRLNIFTDNNAQEMEPQKILLAAISVRNMTNVTINRMYYDVTIENEKGETLYSYPEHFRGAIEPGQMRELNTSKKLNAMLPDDKKLMEQDISKINGKIQITYIAFDDGNVISPNAFIE